MLWEDFRLGPQSGIVHFGMGKNRPTSHPHEFASLLDVGLSKFIPVGHRSIIAHPKANNT